MLRRSNILPVIFSVIFVLNIIISNCCFIVDEREYALVLQFGEVVKVIKDPGIYLKKPFVQNVSTLDKRMLNVMVGNKEVIASDRKRLVVNAFTKYKVLNPRLFYQTVRDTNGMALRMESLLDSSLRNTIGSVPLQQLLTNQRGTVTQNILQDLRKKTKEFGIELIDVRLSRADLPEANSKATYDRMTTDRKQEAARIRSEGKEAAVRIKAEADKRSIITIAEAEKQAQILRGEGDQEAAQIYAKAYSADPNFFAFYRSLDSYRNTVHADNSSVIMSIDNKGFFKHFIGNSRKDKAQ